MTLGGSENSGSVKVSGWESETASLELSSLIRSLPRPPWSKKKHENNEECHVYAMPKNKTKGAINWGKKVQRII